jgi:hypothetical protein
MPVIAGIGSALIGAASANKAANAQTKAANQDIAFQRETRDLIFDRYEPFYEAGQNALDAYNFELGLGDRPTIGGNTLTVTETAAVPGRQTPIRDGRDITGYNTVGGTPAQFRVGDMSFGTREEAQAYADAHSTPGTPYGGFQKSEDYNFRFNEGVNALNAMAGAAGGLVSGKTMQDLTKFGQGFASTERNNYLNRLAGLTDGGMAAAGGQAGAATNAAAGTSNALSAIGNAQSAGAIGMGNAFNTGIGNALGAWQYKNASGTGNPNWLFGGNSWG